MGLELLYVAVVLLIGFAIFDLMVGVSNDAVNFLNSSIGSRVAPRYIIMIIASLGIMAGVSFSSGMMEVARKGIFHPQFFTMPELLTIFLAVMLTDVIILDLFNTYGMPTSTTVSIVFELLGGAVAVSILKILQQDANLDVIAQYINTSKATAIIMGILLSVAISFVFGAIVQFLSRLLFTFDYLKSMKRYGALWGGMALSFITYFVLVKGAKGAYFITPETADSIKENAFVLLFYIFGASAILLQILLMLKVNIFKPIVLVGTFALAMAFAANDLVNFIGVPVAGFQSYTIAMTTDSPLTATMGALAARVPTQTYMLMIAGAIMVGTLWLSKKARTVTETEISLGQQNEDQGRFESVLLSRVIVGSVLNFLNFVRMFIPMPVRNWVAQRLDTSANNPDTDSDRPPFDLLRASVNMMVASAVISYATSQKLPLSTTYVTFMVAMGTSFSDLAWGRESAVYRVAGVLAVVGGWFLTALSAFTLSAVVATIIFYGQAYGVVGLLAVGGWIIWKNHFTHKQRAEQKNLDEVFNLKKITDPTHSISVTFEHMGILLHEIRLSLDVTLKALYDQNELTLKSERKKTKKIQRWANMIAANIFKCMRLLQREDQALIFNYGQTIRRLQKLVDGYRDIVLRSYTHVSNYHKGLLDIQKADLEKVTEILSDMLTDVETALSNKDVIKYKEVTKKDKELRAIVKKLNDGQLERIRTGESKTRLSILFYAIMGNAVMLSKQNLRLVEIFADTFGDVQTSVEFDMD